MTKVPQISLIFICWLGGIGTCLLFLQYFSTTCSQQTFPLHKQSSYQNSSFSITPPKKEKQQNTQEEKPILLLWFTPENYKWSYSDCKTVYNIDDCIITHDRNLYDQADAVMIFHKGIQWNLGNLPKAPRPPFQRWIWFHVESPTNTMRIPGLDNLFNLTLTYRRDSDISVRYWLTVNKTPHEDVIPKKDKLVCWIVSNLRPRDLSRIKFYNELKKYVNVTLFGGITGSRLKAEDYYPTMSSCKFYLSLENTINRDYCTEKVNGPLASGTVPIVLGPPRRNYEEFYPSNSFIHIDDFPNPEELAKYLLELDKDDEAYKRYFDWRKYVSATPHLVARNQEFVIYTCHACQYIARHREYKVAHDIYKWWFP